MSTVSTLYAARLLADLKHSLLHFATAASEPLIEPISTFLPLYGTLNYASDLLFVRSLSNRLGVHRLQLLVWWIGNMNKKEVFKLAKGFRGRAKNCIRIARERVEKALQYSYRDRRNKKRDMRSLWIERINAGTRVHGVNYGNFMHGLVKENIQINRKVLSELSMHEPYSFKALVDVSRTAFPGNRQVPATPKKEGLAILV
ncbi:hypothetical protein L2E82_15591 [Cichorium intybus]|uniref:Uncharacterized protein n=1 Tax=Cichorium intybus TaxID=13427 RepID=A0ACB9F2U0_CICIN|nr:hypothetical protein L2E82_15591 [Cichorium intybus]